MINSFLHTFHNSAINNWCYDVVHDYGKVGTALSYCDICTRIVEYQNDWSQLGLKKGDKVAICSSNSVEWICLFMAIQVSGLVAVCLNENLSESTTSVEHSECSVLYVTDVDVRRYNFDNIQRLQFVISITSNKLLWSRCTLCFKHTRLKQISPDNFHIEERNDKELSLIIYTSGTSANIKGVMLSIGNISANINSIIHVFPYEKNKNYLSVLPFYHIFGLIYDVLMPICYGLHLYILNAPPVPTILLPAFKKVRPVMFFAVPIVYYKLFEEINNSYGDQLRMKSVGKRRSFIMDLFGKECKCLVTGGASVKRDWLQSIYTDYNLPFFIGYGMSECASSICLPHLDSYELFSCGKPIDNIELKIVSPSPTSTPGEIVLRGNVVFCGYYKDEKLYNNVVDDKGWFHTQDLAIMSNQGDVFIKGRMNNMKVSSAGKNIYLEEVEAKLTEINGIKDAVVSLQDDSLIAYIVKDETYNEKQITEAVMNFNQDSAIGIYIREVKLIATIARTAKGTIKRNLYI